MDFNNEATWPDDLLAYLEANHDLFLSWETHDGSVSGNQYDNALRGLRAVLDRHSLHGYHCTRLTPREMAYILANGMQLPNATVLEARIRALQGDGVIDMSAAEHLIATNQAREANRANRIWFCFFPPRSAGQRGIGSLLGYWGGEALYNSHERDPITRPILAKIGTPCLVEADVPIASRPGPSFLDMKAARQFLIWRGYQTVEPVEHEDRATQPISAGNIRRIIQFPEPDFVTLTGCDDWKPPLF
jgi:hypothetical protein